MSRQAKKKDPFAAREAAKYKDPIPSREFIIQHLLSRKEPASLRQLVEDLSLRTEEKQEALRRRLKAMLRDGQLEQLSKRRFWPYGKRILVEGKLLFDKNKKLWCLPHEGGARILIPYYPQNLVVHGSKVVVSMPDLQLAKGEMPEGKILEVLEQTVSNQVVGRFIKDHNKNYVISHDKECPHDIVIPEDKINDAVDGDIVLIEITNLPSRWVDPVGNVVKIIGSEKNKGIEIDAAIHNYSLPNEWSKGVSKQVAKFEDKISTYALRQRRDLRDLPLVTIDGEDAKDFDDAVYCQPKPKGGWKLYVAIADVSYYVKPNSELDKEAVSRGNSVYFPGKVVPMLPEKLSNGLCSLLPEVDRLCMVCEMSISKEGKLTRYEFYEAVMRSKARLTYTKVAKILARQSKQLAVTYADVVDDLFNLEQLYLTLHQQRELRGAIDFDTVSTQIIFNSKGKISRIEAQTRNVAHKIIEECMLCANVATAKFLEKHKIPGLYRVHDAPPIEKVTDLKTFLNEIGLSLGKQGSKSNKQEATKEANVKNKKKLNNKAKNNGIAEEELKLHPLAYGELLKKIKDRPDAGVIQMILLRSLCQAVYSPDNLGHFGLAYSAYTHFTSPIRRYPDLLVHRQIKEVISGKWAECNEVFSKEEKAKLKDKFKELALHCSSTERKADEATRYVEQWLKCQYMCRHVGQVFSGVISGVNRFGFFVELKDIYVDGLVHISSLRDDYYNFNGVHHNLLGENTGRKYSLGMVVEVIIAKVDVDSRRIDLETVNNKKSQNTKLKSKASKNKATNKTSKFPKTGKTGKTKNTLANKGKKKGNNRNKKTV